MKSRQEWQQRLTLAEGQLGYDMGWKFLYCPWSTIREAEFAFISLNPGKAPPNTEPRMVSDENGNSYEIERNITLSPITEQFLALCALLQIAPEKCLTGVIAPFRTPNWQVGRDRPSLDIGKEFWKEVFSISPVRTLFAIGADAEKALVEIVSAELDYEIPSGWGISKIRRYSNGRRFIIALPHLSRFRLLSVDKCKEQIKLALLDNPSSSSISTPAPVPAPRTGTGTGTGTGSGSMGTLPKDLPLAIHNFFQALSNTPGYRLDIMKMQLAIYFQGTKVGGLNPRNKHWYFSKVFLANTSGISVAEKHGFRKIDIDGKHQYWMLNGFEGCEPFTKVLVALTQSPLRFE